MPSLTGFTINHNDEWMLVLDDDGSELHVVRGYGPSVAKDTRNVLPRDIDYSIAVRGNGPDEPVWKVISKQEFEQL